MRNGKRDAGGGTQTLAGCDQPCEKLVITDEIGLWTTRSNSIRFSDEIATIRFETSGVKLLENSYFLPIGGKLKSHTPGF
jgi:hypothetical protein